MVRRSGLSSGDREASPIWPLPDNRLTRFALGLPVNGHWHSDADWLSWGSKPIGRRPPRELWGLRLGYRPGYQRTLFRWSCCAAPIVETTSWVFEPLYTGVFHGVCIAGAIGAVTWANSRRPVNVDVAEPTRNALQLQLAELLDTPYADASIQADGSVSVVLPREFILTDRTAKELNDLVTKTVRGDFDVALPDLTKSRVVHWHPVPEPPDQVKYDAILDTMLALPEGKLYIGQDNRGRDVVHDLDTDAPHIAMSMPTGKGKSTQFRLVLSQLIAQGADVTLVDVKRVSLHEFRATEGINIVRDTQACWDVIRLYLAEVEERYAQLEAVDVTKWPAIMAKWTRRVLVIEELNAFFNYSRIHWDAIRTSKDRAKPPIYDTFGSILMMARAAKMHVLVASQRFEAATIGGGANRTQFGLRLLGNPSAQDWKMLGEGTKPRGAMSKQAGRVAAVLAGESQIVQLGFLTLEQARHHAATYRSPLSVVAPSYLPSNQQKDGGPSYDDASKNGKAGITLREYAALHDDSLEALRAAVQRAGLEHVGTGAHNAKLYDPAKLTNLRSGTPSYDPSTVVVDSDDDE